MNNTTANTLAPHEMLELRELINTEVLGIKKTQASMAMVEDGELKAFMESCLNNKIGKLQAMQQLVNSVNYQ